MTVAADDQASGILALANDGASHWRLRRTERVVFDDAVTLAYTVVMESSLSAQVIADVGKLHEKVPIPLTHMSRRPARHVRCYMESTEIAVASRSFERSVYSSWVACRVFSDEQWHEELSRLLGDTTHSKENLEEDVRAACGWALDESIADGTAPLACGLSSSQLWPLLAQMEPSAIIAAQVANANRTIIALPEISTPTPPETHVCFTLRYHGVAKRYPATLSRLGWKYLRSRSSRDEDAGNASEFGLWRTGGADGAGTPQAAGPVERLRAWRYETMLRLRYLLPLRRVTIDPDAEADARAPNRLVLADGSAMHVTRASGRQAEALYLSHWRWPWEIPDCMVIDIPVGDAIRAASFHFELEVPAGTYIRSAILRVLNKTVPASQADAPVSEMILVGDDDAHPDRAHLHFTKRLSSIPDNSALLYYPSCVRIVLRPTWHDGLRVAMFAQAVSALTLMILVLTFGLEALGVNAWIPMGGDNMSNADAMVALVTLAPAIALSWIARHNEHMLTKQVQGRLRFRLGASAMTSYVSALIVALGSSEEYVFWVLALAAAIGGLCLAITVRSGLYSRRAAGRVPDAYASGSSGSTDMSIQRR